MAKQIGGTVDFEPGGDGRGTRLTVAFKRAAGIDAFAAAVNRADRSLMLTDEVEV